MDTKKCPACEGWEVLVQIARDERDDARREREELRVQLARVRAQLRDEERENGALRRRLREGGR